MPPLVDGGRGRRLLLVEEGVGGDGRHGHVGDDLHQALAAAAAEAETAAPVGRQQHQRRPVAAVAAAPVHQRLVVDAQRRLEARAEAQRQVLLQQFLRLQLANQNQSTKS